MFIEQQPVYGLNYNIGQTYFTFDTDSKINKGIAWFSYKDEKVPEYQLAAHCGICVGNGIGVAASASRGIVDYENLEDIFNDSKKRIFFKEIRDITEYKSIKLAERAISYIGTKYDYKLCLGIAISESFLIRNIFNERVRLEILRFFDAKDRVICSEFVAKCIYEEGYLSDKFIRYRPNQLVTSNIYKGWKRREYGNQ